MTREQELLQQAAEALMNCAKAALTVKPTLSEPYEPPYEEWTPYTRWVERPAHCAHDLAVTIRRHLAGSEHPGHTEQHPGLAATQPAP